MVDLGSDQDYKNDGGYDVKVISVIWATIWGNMLQHFGNRRPILTSYQTLTCTSYSLNKGSYMK